MFDATMTRASNLDAWTTRTGSRCCGGTGVCCHHQDITHEIYHDDAVLEFPQSGERFEGVANFREWRRSYPTDLGFEMRRVRGEGDLWIVENSIRYGDGEWQPTVTILEFRGDVAHETIYITEQWAPPDWRAPWRSAP